VAEHKLVSNSAVDNVTSGVFTLHTPLCCIRLDSNGLPVAAVLPRLTTTSTAEKLGVFRKQVCAELQDENDGYRLTVFVSGRNISDGANDDSFRLELHKVVQLGGDGRSAYLIGGPSGRRKTYGMPVEASTQSEEMATTPRNELIITAGVGSLYPGWYGAAVRLLEFPGNEFRKRFFQLF